MQPFFLHNRDIFEACEKKVSASQKPPLIPCPSK
jgi:hypothetical protein